MGINSTMLEGFENIFQKHVTQDDIGLFMGALAPIFLVYVGVFLYLLLRICYTALKNQRKPIKASNIAGRKSFDDDDDLLTRTDSVECLKKSLQCKPRNLSMRDSAQSAFFEVAKGEDLNELKSSLRKTNTLFSQPSEGACPNKIEMVVEENSSSYVSFQSELTCVNNYPEVSSFGSRPLGYTHSAQGDNSLESQDLKTNCRMPDSFVAVEDRGAVTFQTFQGNGKPL